MSKWYQGGSYGGFYGGYSRWRKTVSEFKDEVDGTTPTLGRKQVSVTFSGGKAGIIGDSNINFPELAPSDELSTKEFDVFRGYVDHASSMLRFSDMGIYKSLMGKSKENPLLMNIFESIEGARVSREYCHNYIGAKRNISELIKEVADKTIDAQEKGPSVDKYAMLGPAISTMCMDKMGGSYTWWQQQRLGKHIDMDKIKQYADRVWDLKDTQEAYDLAMQIYKEETKENPPEEEPNSGDGDADGDGEKNQTTTQSLLLIISRRATLSMKWLKKEQRQPYVHQRQWNEPCIPCLHNR
jgi:hypothetical protein